MLLRYSERDIQNNMCYYTVDENGTKQGQFERYARNGKLLTRCTYRDGKLHGLYESYHENGKLSIKCTYNNGKEEGLYETYHENSQLKAKCYYRNGEQDGPYELHDSNGVLYEKGVFYRGIELSGQAAEDYLRKWQDGQQRTTEKNTMDITFLTEEQIWGSENGTGQLYVMKKYGTKVAQTDLATILGGVVDDIDDDRTSEGDLTCTSWSASSHSNGSVHFVTNYPAGYWRDPDVRDISARPALPPSETSKISTSETKTCVNGVQIVEYGEYPQTVADERTSDTLENLFKSRSLRSTEKNYTFDSIDLYNYHVPFQATSYQEYEMAGKRYIRVPGRPADSSGKLSTGEQVEAGKPYWVQVQPIEWLMDPSRWMVSKKCLFAGIQFDTKKEYDGHFENTFMKHYLDTYFAKEMVAERPIDKEHKKIVQNLKDQLSVASDITQHPIDDAKTPERQAKAEELVIARRQAEVMNRITRKILSGGDKALEEKMAKTTDQAKLSALYREAYAKLSDDDKKLCSLIGKETGAMMTKAKDTLEKERRFLRTRRKSGIR